MGIVVNMNLRDIKIPENAVHRVLNYGLITRNQIAGVLDMVIKDITFAQATKITDFTDMEIFCFGNWEKVYSGDRAKIEACYADEKKEEVKIETAPVAEEKNIVPSANDIMKHIDSIPEAAIQKEVGETVSEMVASELPKEEAPVVEEPTIELNTEEVKEALEEKEELEEEPVENEEAEEVVEEVEASDSEVVPVEFQKQKFQPKKKKH